MIKFSIIIPILNEAKNIQKLANILKKELGFQDDYYDNKISYLFVYVEEGSCLSFLCKL